MIDPLIRKLDQLGSLSDAEKQALTSFPLNVRPIGGDLDLICAGDHPSDCQLILEGFVYRYKTIEDGRRQIVSFHIPGDIVDLNSLLLGQMDHNVATLTQVKVAAIPHAILLEWMRNHPHFARLLWRDTLIDASIFREWVLNVGRRSATERIAHLLCEVVTRLRAVGLECDLPITQAKLADATGLSAVHVNRTVQELQGDGLIELSGKMVAMLDWERLKRTAGFDPGYLHQLAAAA